MPQAEDSEQSEPTQESMALSWRAEVWEGGNVSWMFKNGAGAWVPYGSDESEALEEGFASESECVELQGGLYVVDIPSRRQKRLSSNVEREVRPPHSPA